MAAIIIMHCSKSKEQKQKEAQAHKELVQRWNSLTPAGQRAKALREAAIEYVTKIDTALLKYEKYRKLFCLGYTVFLALLPVPAFAAAGASGGIALIKLMQQASFWVGIGVVVWGIVEAQLDLPGWKSRILKGILGYIAILLVPLLFINLRDNLQIDVWQQLNGK